MGINWLFLVLLLFFCVFVIRGLYKGMIRTAMSVISIVVVTFLTVQITPAVGEFLGTQMGLQHVIEEKCISFFEKQIWETNAKQGEKTQQDSVIKESIEDDFPVEYLRNISEEELQNYLDGVPEEKLQEYLGEIPKEELQQYLGKADKEKLREQIEKVIEGETEIPLGAQIKMIENLPLPRIMKDKLLENNNSVIYEQLQVHSFVQYLSAYITQIILRAIAFLGSFVIALIIMKLILYVVELLTQLPVINGMNRLGGAVFGAVQGLFWIWVVFLIITLSCSTEIGGRLMEMIYENAILQWLYNKNYFLQIIAEFVM